MSKISIIIPVFNAEKYLKNCIACILKQSFEDYEAIFVDDGSNDFSLDILLDYAKRYNKVKVFHQAHKGVSSARNLGLSNSNSDYVTFIDSDDFVNENYLDDLIKYGSTDYVVSGFVNKYIKHTQIIREEVRQISAQEGESIYDIKEDFFIKGFIHSCCGKLYKRSIIKENSIEFSSVRLSEDTYFNLDYLKHIKSFKIIDKCNYYYMHYLDYNSATRSFYSNDINIYIDLHTYMNKMKIPNEIVKKTIYPQYLGICIKSFKYGHTIDEKGENLKKIIKNQIVQKTLLSTYTNFGEYITGILFCLGNINLVAKWFKIIYR